LVGFVNPAAAGLLVVELKNPCVPARAAFDEILAHYLQAACRHDATMRDGTICRQDAGSTFRLSPE
jgi:hypothetical protein